MLDVIRLRDVVIKSWISIEQTYVWLVFNQILSKIVLLRWEIFQIFTKKFRIGGAFYLVNDNNNRSLILLMGSLLLLIGLVCQSWRWPVRHPTESKQSSG